MKLYVAVLVQILISLLLVLGSADGSFDESPRRRTRHLPSVTVLASEDVASAHAATVPDISRVLKKAKGTAKEPKAPKSRKKVSKSSKACASIRTQKDALLALKGGFDNGDAVLTTWNSDTEPCDDEWTGITCSNAGEVTTIDLTSKSLEGTISPLIGCPTTLISSLTIVGFGNNTLSETIPMELTALTSLTQLFLWQNRLEGTIPTELGKLSSLTSLDLGINSLEGTIPIELTALANLEYLLLDMNDLTGSMPSGICEFRSPDGPLIDLWADYCDPTPEVICTCCNNQCNER